MASFAPRSVLETHEVTNQPPDYINRNFYLNDPAMTAAVQRHAGPWLDQRLRALGESVGSEQVLEWGRLANRHRPELVSFDRYGRRLDEVEFHPAYHELMALSMEHGIHDLAWTIDRPGAHLAHYAMLSLFTQAEAGTMCPINMTYAGVAALKPFPEIGGPWLEKIIGGRYAAPLRPMAEKRGVTLGMAMTEKQGGSDVRANATRAEAISETAGAYRLTGHKWFASAPMSDAFLTLAQSPGGLSCFLVPRILADGSRNPIHLTRLKDKLGNHSNASAEIEYHGATGLLIGSEGRGVKVIIEMVHHTRLGTIASTTGLMRAALVQALNHVRGRRAFQMLLIDQPLMRNVIADLALEYEAAVVLGSRIAAAFGAADGAERGFARLGVAIAKYWLTKRAPGFVYECLEAHGGVGYVEETPMPRLFRESPLNAIWEGSGNVIALDILRTLTKQPQALAAYRSEIAPALGRDGALDKAYSELDQALETVAGSPIAARLVAEKLALVLTGALLVRHAPEFIARSWCAARLDPVAHHYGTLDPKAPIEAIVDRQLSAL